MESKEFVKLLGIIYQTNTCESCQQDVRYQVIVSRQWKTCVIPLYPISKKYYLSCPKCNHRKQITRQETQEYLKSITQEKKNHKHKQR